MGYLYLQCTLNFRVGFFPEKTYFFLSSGKNRKKLEETGKNGKNWKKLKTLFSKGNIITKHNQMGAYNNTMIECFTLILNAVFFNTSIHEIV